MSGNLLNTPRIYIEYVGFGLVGFYGISTILDYLMPIPFLFI